MSPAWTHPLPGPRAFDGPGPSSKAAKKAKLPNPRLPCQVAGNRDLASEAESKNPSWLNPDPGSDLLHQIQDLGPTSTSRRIDTVRQIHIDMPTLLMASSHSNSVDPSSRTKYSRRGSDADRIRLCLRQRCKCSFRCKANMNEKHLLEFCERWHLLSDDAQSHLLQVCYWSAGPGAVDEEPGIEDECKLRTKAQWFLLGIRVSVSCLASMLGISERKLFNFINGVPDRRKEPFSTVKHHHHEFSGQVVHQFFWELYKSAAEDLPEDPIPTLSNVDDAIRSDKANVPEVFDDIPEWTPNDLATDLLALHNDNSETVLRPRKIQHGHLRDIWWQFVAWFSALPALSPGFDAEKKCPSWSTFWRVWRARWCKLIKFREISQHSQCEICFDCKQFLQRGRASTEEKHDKAKQWRRHLTMTYLDRLLYWHIRFQSKLREDCMVCIIIDSMDKTKLSWPQFNFVTPKGPLDHFIRPKLIITCALAHGFGGFFYISHDDTCSHGASNFLDVLCRTIQRVFQICEEKRWRAPDQLVLQTDNTTAQAKNKEALLFLSSCVCRNLFSAIIHNYLQKGHAHEDVDAIFGLVLSRVLHRRKFALPSELATQLQLSMAPTFHAKGEICEAQLHTHSFDFGQWLAPLGVELSGAFKARNGVQVPHSFILKKRRDLSVSEAQALAMAGTEGMEG